MTEHLEATNVWENYDDEEYRRDQSHWRGYGRWKDDDAWQAIGKETKSNIETLFSHIGRNFSDCGMLNYLEWGPGGGSNIFQLREHAYSYYGIDISEKNLNEAKRMIDNEGYSYIFKPILTSSQPMDILNQINEKIDVFISTAVFQHFPSKSYGEEVLKVVSSTLKEGGTGVVQIRFDNGNPRFKPIETLNCYKDKHITANSYALDEFWDLLKNCGLNPLYISKIRSANNYATYFFVKK